VQTLCHPVRAVQDSGWLQRSPWRRVDPMFVRVKKQVDKNMDKFELYTMKNISPSASGSCSSLRHERYQPLSTAFAQPLAFVGFTQLDSLCCG